MQLASVKAVGEGYPLLGELRVSATPGGALQSLRHGPRAGVGRMGVPFDESALFQQHKHRPHSAGIGRHAAGEFPLREGAPAVEVGQDDKLVHRDTVRRECCLRPAAHRQVRGAEGNRDIAVRSHRRLASEVVTDRQGGSIAGSGSSAKAAHRPARGLDLNWHFAFFNCQFAISTAPSLRICQNSPALTVRVDEGVV
jgi:hypothetical protein